MSRRTKLLRKENNEMEKQLQADGNASLLTDIVVYLRSANISPYDQEKVRRDIREMLMEGEKRGETAEDIIGGDYKLFCDEVVAEIPKLSRKESILGALRDGLLSADVLLAIWFVWQAVEQIILTGALSSFTLTAGNIISFLLIMAGASLMFHAFSKNTFILNAASEKKVFFILFAAIFALLLLCTAANILIQYPLCRIPAFVVAGGAVLLFIVYKILDAKLD